MTRQMARLWIALVSAGVGVGCAGLDCGGGGLGAPDGGALPEGFGVTEWEIVTSLSPLAPLPEDPTNMWADDEAAARLGQKLFFDCRLSGAMTAEGATEAPEPLGQVGDVHRVACFHCHGANSWFSDHRTSDGAVSFGVGKTSHNAPSLVNAAYYDWFGWAGQSDSIWMQSLVALESGKTLDGSRLRLAHVLYDHHRAEYEAVFGEALPEALGTPDGGFPEEGKPNQPAWEYLEAGQQQVINRVFTNGGKALGAYLRRLTSRNSPFDRFVAGDHGALNASQQRGLRLFIGPRGNCVHCHSGPNFAGSDKPRLQQFQNTGVSDGNDKSRDGHLPALQSLLMSELRSDGPWSDDQTLDWLEGLEPAPAELGRFRTKSLRQIAMTAPYFHNGSAKDLQAVVDFYDRGGDPDGGFAGTRDPSIKPLFLTAEEKADLIAFLESLTGELPPETWRAPATIECKP